MESRNLTQGSILGNITTFALPYMLSYFLQILYGLADLFVIGMYCDVESTTAVSNGAQVMHMLTVIIIGLAMGTTVRTARAVGAGDFRTAARTIGNTVTLFLSIAIVLAIGLLLLTDNIIRWINTPIEAVEGTYNYLFICFLGIPFIVAYNIIASIFRGLGDSKMPMYFVAIACVVNILLDFVFIGRFGMGPAGAALATTLSQMCAVAIAIAVIARRQSSIRITRSDLRPQRNVMRGILNKDAGLFPPKGVLSHVAVIEMPGRERLLSVSDVAVIPLPDFKQKTILIGYLAKTAKLLGIDCPKIACIAPSEQVLPSVPSSTEGAILAKMGDRGQLGNVIVDGPLSLDVALYKEVAEHKKVKGSSVAGDPDCLLFPNIESANVFFKAASHFAGAELAAMVMGTKVPCVLTSRGDTALTKKYSIALACLAAR